MVPTMSLLYLQTLLEAPELVGADREIAEAARTRAINIVHPGKLDELERERAAVQLLTNATAAAADAMRDLADLPNAHALNDFLNSAVPDQRHIQADVERETELAAGVTKETTMTKTLDADSAAKQVTDSLQPTVDFNGAAGVKQTPLPAKKPLRADLARALGQTQS